MSLSSLLRTVLEVEGCRTAFGDEQDCSGGRGLGPSKVGSRLSSHICLYTGNSTHFAITWAAEAFSSKGVKLGTEGGRDRVEIHRETQ